MAESSDKLKMKSKGSFQAMGLDKDLMKGLNRMGYTAPTPVQRKALPIVIAGVDVVCMARTGSGKTCVFLLPLVQKVKTHDPNSGVRAIVLSPTRELAIQTFKFAKDMAKFTDLRIISIVGGDPIEGQFDALSQRPDVIVATPGRLMHHLREVSTFKLKHVKYLVFDEADRLFEMGFAEQLNEIVRECPTERQTLLFSATMPKQLVQFSRAGLRDPQLVRLDTDTKMSEELRLAFLAVRSNEKVAALLYLIRRIIPSDQLTIVFTATKHHSEFLHALFNIVGVTSTMIYGAMDQEVRSANLRLFREGQVSFLIVTDVAARGIDVPLLNNVINFHFPPAPKLFVHRCGRAARQGRIGFAFSLVEPEELAYMADVHLLLGMPVKTSMNGGVGVAEVGDEDEDDDAVKQTAVPALSTQMSTDTVVTVPPYTLKTMTPLNVHTGLLPQDVIDEENDFLKRVLADNDALMNLYRISENGMKQYRRTRSEASREGVKNAKSLTKGDLIRTIHPLIAGEDPARCSARVVEKANFVRILQSFRPAQTVLETGIGTGCNSQAVKKKNKAADKESKGTLIMKALRLTTRTALERNKVHVTTESLFDEIPSSSNSLLISSSKPASKRRRVTEDSDDEDAGAVGGFAGDSDGEDEDGMNGLRDDFSDEEGDGADHHTGLLSFQTPSVEKPRLSIAEKKKLKKKGFTNEQISAVAVKKAATDQLIAAATLGSTSTGKNGNHRDQTANNASSSSSSSADNSGPPGSGQFRDKRFFMSYGNEDEVVNFSEESMQPNSGLRTGEAQNAMMMENAMLDLSPEDALELNRKKRLLRWDSKKRKFVRQTLEEMSGAKKGMRSEVGVTGRNSSTKPQGEMYETWKKKTRREISIAGTGDEDDRPRPNVNFNKNVKSELRGATEIRKINAERDNNKKKNMTKDKRKQMEGKARKSKAKVENTSKRMQLGGKGSSRKCKVIVRY